VDDVNDNAPRFDQPIYHARMLENEPPGTLVGRVHARDGDHAENGLVRYRLAAVDGVDQGDAALGQKDH
jgi:hypothetical protein